MKIAFDAKRFFFNNTGLGNYSRTLVYSLLNSFTENEYFLYSPKYKDLQAEFIPFKKLHTVFPSNKFPFWRQFGITKDLQKHKIQLFHGLSHEIPFGLSQRKINSVVSVHDLIFEVYPKLFNPIDAFIYQKKYKNSCLRADKIIAISESTKQDIIRFYNVDKAKINVVYQACNQLFKQRVFPEMRHQIKTRYRLPENYILYVGSVIERKNLLDLVKAVEKLPENLKIPIVAVGNGKEYLQQIEKYVAEKNLQNYFIRLQEIENNELPGIYQMADLFVYTSSYEGFGIPVLEALYSEIPVITSNVSSLPEAGGDAACYVSPGDVDELRATIIKVLENKELAQVMIQKGIRHARKFTNQKMAQDTMAVYQKLCLHHD